MILNRRVITGWMIDFFKAKKIDVSHHYQICYFCRVSLYKARKDNSVVEKVNEISGFLSKAKLDENSYFDQLPESDFQVIKGLNKILVWTFQFLFCFELIFVY
jgi:hypothetical protein